MRFLLTHLLRDAAGARPGAEAVRVPGQGSLTYAEVADQARRLAGTFSAAGIERGDRVGIHLPKRLETVVAVYGAMEAGAAYVPLDPRAPVRRTGTVAADCTIAAVVTTAARADDLVSAMAPHVPALVVCVDGEPPPLPCPTTGWEVAVAADPIATDPGTIDQDLAYILYTSGSTGVPKGVMLSHRNALTFVEWCVATIGVHGDDRLSNHAPLHFDLSVFDLFVASAAGATVVLVPDEAAYLGAELARLIRDDGISIWYSVPSALTMLVRALREPGELPTLREVVFAGEVFPTKQLRELRRLLPDVRLWNLYGPTETNVCTYHVVGDLPEDDRPIPIGRACGNTDVFALRDEGGVAGVGEEGELYVRGSTVMKGYWGRPERTSEVLVPNPLAPNHGDAVYRTGDLVRLRPDGDYDFLGRRDHQIKSRGYRIELGEVEAALNAHPDLAEAVAVAVPHQDWGSAIVVYVAPAAGIRPGAADLKRHLVERVPRYMLPWRIEVVDELPRTSTGKVDRAVLAERAREPEPRVQGDARPRASARTGGEAS